MIDYNPINFETGTRLWIYIYIYIYIGDVIHKPFRRKSPGNIDSFIRPWWIQKFMR